MYVGTHVCLPLIPIVTIDIVRVLRGKQKLLTNWQLFFVGIAGFLPDLLWPHFSRAGRLNSLTHTIWFLVLILPLVFLAARITIKQNYILFSLLFWLATVSHVFLDTISGGARLLYPLSEKISGSYFVPWPLWLKMDILFVILLTILLVNRRILIQSNLSAL
jgi:hypothetical protein